MTEGKTAALVAFAILTWSQAPHALADSIPEDTLISLKRYGCYGTCPVYEVELHADGQVHYTGRAFVELVGQASSTVSPDQLRHLLRRFESLSFYSLRNRYSEPSDGCTRLRTDHPAADVSLQSDGNFKSVHHYRGCYGPSALPGLTRLAEEIDRVANTARWILPDPPEFLESENREVWERNEKTRLHQECMSRKRPGCVAKSKPDRGHDQPCIRKADYECQAETARLGPESMELIRTRERAVRRCVKTARRRCSESGS